MKNVIITICLMLVASAAWASGAELLVPSQYPTIQSAIDDCNDGDVIIVAPGTYTGTGNRDIDFLGKAITVRSENGPESCIINYENSGRGFYFHNNEGPSSVLNGFTISSGTNYSGEVGIHCDSSSPTISKCIITGYNSWGGIYCRNSNVVIKCCLFLSTGGSTAIHIYAPYLASVFCVIENNIIASTYFGIYLDESYLGEVKGIIRNNVIASLGTRNGSGIYYRMQHANPTVAGNIITNCEKGIWFEYNIIENERKAQISYNNLWNNTVNYVSDSVPFDLTGLQGNISANPLFIDPNRKDYHLQLGSPCIDAGTDTGVYTDYDGNIRPIDGDNDGLAVSDIGAFEFQDSPAIMVSPVDMTFYAKKNEENPPSQLLSVRNAGTNTLKWQISENCDWLSAEPNSGSSIGEIDNVSLSVDITGLPIGIYTCNLTISDANACNNPQTLVIRLIISKDVLHVPSECGAIQEAINVAQDGAVIIVAHGTYTGPGNRDIDFLGKAITVRSENGPENCIIDCNGLGRGFYFHQYEDANSVLDGFTITNGLVSSDGGGICCGDSSPKITNCIISGNHAEYDGGGISCYYHSSPTITNCTISGNHTEEDGGGIYCIDSSSPKIINCNIIGNSANYYSGGISCDYECRLTVTNCTITGNSNTYGGCGIYCGGGSSSKIANCIFWNNAAQTGAEIYGSADVTYSDVQGGRWGEGNINADPLLTPDGRLQAGSPCIDAGNPDFLLGPGQVDIDGQPRVMGGRVDIGADEVPKPLVSAIILSSGKFYFNFNEGGPAPEPQVLSIRNLLEDTLNWEVTEDCSWLEVYPSTGSSTDEPNYVTLSVDITGLATGVYNCTFTISSPTAAPRMVAVTLCVYNPELLLVPVEYSTIQSAINASVSGDTVVVTPGTYTSPGNWDIDFLGKAITVRSVDPTDPLIVAGTIIDCYKPDGYPPQRGFSFHNNEDANSVLDGFTITDSSGAIYCYDNSSPKITNCIISGNHAEDGGSGIYCKRQSNPTITNCIITANTTSYYEGGAIYCYDNSSPKIINCIISGNFAGDRGGGIYCDDNGNPKIINCTIAGNSAEYEGGGIYCENSSPRITNCILWNNTAPDGPEIYVGYESNTSVSYTDVEGGQAAVYIESNGKLNWLQGNIDYDPYFVDAANGDYHLLFDSPCIDSGDPSYIPEPNETDLDGNPRVICERIDMGAYEHTPNGLTIAVSAKSFYFTQEWPKPAPQTLLIRSCGGEPLHWEIVEDCNWLQVSPANGVYTDQINKVAIEVDPNGLPPAVYTCSFEVRDPNASNNPVTVHVTMRVVEILRVPSQDFDTIQDAIDAADNYDIVLVADGNYTGTGNRDIDFLGKTITVCSENGPNNCTIDCNGTEAEPHRGFYFHNKETEYSLVDGFTITNGYATNGGGIYCYISSPTIRNCNIIGNSAKNYGGGIYCASYYFYNSSPKITNCIISENSARFWAGGIGCRESSPIITDCTISGNSSPITGGIDCIGSNPKITDCTISGNSADGYGMYGYGVVGGIYCCRGNPIITNCIISKNSARDGSGGIIYEGDGYPAENIAITNSTITGNSGINGGIACFYVRRTLTIANCTISGNSASYSGGGISCYWSSPIITNCILWANTAEVDGNQIALYSANYPSTLTITYSDVEGGLSAVHTEPNCSVIWGLGNIDADPRFVEPGYWADANNPNIIVEPNDPNAVWIDGDYHLKSEGWSWDTKRSRWTYDDVTSHCIDAGNPGSPLGDEPLSVPDDPNNIWGQNLRIDMGAFGGTAEASIPPYDWALLADLTNDGLVDLADFAYQAADWLNSADQQPGDLNRDSLVDISDLALLIEDWLKQTTWY